MRLVVDASVAVKWVLPEQHGAAALRLATAAFRLAAPELLWVEVASALRKRLRRGDLSLAAFRDSLGDMEAWNVAPEAIRPLLRPAADLALHLDHGVYDCLYLALAERERCQLVTADCRLHDKVDRSPFASLTLWIADLP